MNERFLKTPGLYGVVAIAMVAGYVSDVHADDSSAPQSCEDLENDSARLACYDEVAGRRNPSSDQTGPATVDEQPMPLTEEVGEEQVASDKKSQTKESKFRGTVTKCSKGPTGKWYFYFQNGQVWQQRDDDRLRFKDCNFDVTISKDFFGYKMQIEGESGKTRIARVK